MDYSYVRFQRGLLTNYQALETKSEDTLYFVYDEDKGSTALYLGNRLIAGTGEIIGPSNLDELNDVLIKTVAYKDILQYDSGKNQWINISFANFITQIKAEFNFENLATKEDITNINSSITNIENQLNIFAKAEDVEKKADKATTLAGYGITDAYTKEETLAKISEKITEINGGESAGEVLADLNSYIEINNERVINIENRLNDLDVGDKNTINTVDENEFNLIDKHLSLKILDASKLSGLETHSVITNLETLLNQKVAQETYEAQMTSISNELTAIKDVITWKDL